MTRTHGALGGQGPGQRVAVGGVDGSNRGLAGAVLVGHRRSPVGIDVEQDQFLNRFRLRKIPHDGGSDRARGPEHRHAGRRTADQATRLHASDSTVRNVVSIWSNCSGPHIRGGASWMTGSPRSSARQISPDSNSAPDR